MYFCYSKLDTSCCMKCRSPYKGSNLHSSQETNQTIPCISKRSTDHLGTNFHCKIGGIVGLLSEICLIPTGRLSNKMHFAFTIETQQGTNSTDFRTLQHEYLDWASGLWDRNQLGADMHLCPSLSVECILADNQTNSPELWVHTYKLLLIAGGIPCE